MKAAFVFAMTVATCTPQFGDPPPAVVVDAGPAKGNRPVCETACHHLVAVCGFEYLSECVSACMLGWGTNTGAVVDWTCAANESDKKGLQRCGLNVCP